MVFSVKDNNSKRANNEENTQENVHAVPLSIMVRAFSPFYVCAFLFPNCFVFNFGEWRNCNGWNATAFRLSTLDGWTRDRSKCRRWRDRREKKLSESIETKWRMQVLQPHRSSAQFCNLMHYVYDGAVVVFDAAALDRRATAIFEKWMHGALALSRAPNSVCVF